MRNLFFAMVVVLFFGCSTLQVQVDYDPEFDFSSLSSFSVVYNKKNDGKDFTRARIAKALTSHIQEKGYKSVEKAQASFYVSIHLDIQKRSQVETNYETMGIRPVFYPYFRYNRYVGTSAMIGMEPDVRVTTSTYEYEVGKLVIEVLDVTSKAVVWQGVAEDEFSSNTSPEKKDAYINKVVKELFEDFPPR